MNLQHIINIHQFAQNFANEGLHTPQAPSLDRIVEQKVREVAAHGPEGESLTPPHVEQFSAPTRLSAAGQRLHSMLTAPLPSMTKTVP